MSTSLFLVRFAELGLKSRYVRGQFLRRLKRNIVDRFSHERTECAIRSDGGHLYVTVDVQAGYQVLPLIFGIASFSRAVESTSKMEDIEHIASEMAASFDDGTFAVRARRTGEHGYTSQELAASVGAAVLRVRPDLKVDLGKPDHEVFAEVRQARSYIYADKVPGPGGMPLGTQGKVDVLWEDDRSLLAGWMMMKRGCEITLLKEEGRIDGNPLERWVPGLRTKGIGSLEEELNGPSAEGRERFVTLGWSLRELEERGNPKRACFFPLIGLSDDRIDQLRKRVI